MKGYDIKVRLKDFRPLTWRDLIIPEHLTFKQLHLIMQKLWDLDDYHLYDFTFKDSNTKIVDFDRFGHNEVDPDGYWGMKDLDADKTYIKKYFDSMGKIFYEYDFGDSWLFTIEVKKLVDYDKTYPTIKRFKGDYGPVEDCGGMYELADMIYDEEHGEDMGLEKFDMKYAQKILKMDCNFKYDEKFNQNPDEEDTVVDTYNSNSDSKGYDLDFIINDLQPATSRKIQTLASITFEQLHEIIQIVFDFENNYEYKFIHSSGDEIVNADDKIENYFSKTGVLYYQYGIDYSWNITIKLRRVLSYISKATTIVDYMGEYNPLENYTPDDFILLMKIGENVFKNTNKFNKSKIQKKLYAVAKARNIKEDVLLDKWM